MTALAAFFALIPGACALERGSEANAPLARAILGGLLAGEPATLFVLPVLYSLLIHDTPQTEEERKARLAAHSAGRPRRSRSDSAGRVERRPSTRATPKKTRTIDSGRGRLYPESPSPGRSPG